MVSSVVCSAVVNLTVSILQFILSSALSFSSLYCVFVPLAVMGVFAIVLRVFQRQF